MITHLIESKIVMSLVRTLVAHRKIAVTLGTIRICVIEIKGARKGKIYGKGGEGKVPKFDFRIKVTATDEFKKLVSKEIENLI